LVLASKTSTLAGLLVAAAVLYLARDVLIPLALAILASFLLAPLVRRLERWHLGRIPSTLLSVAVAAALIAGIAYVAGREALSLAAKLPEYRENIRAKLRALRAPDNGALGRATEAIKQLESEAAPAAAAPLPWPNAAERLRARRMARPVRQAGGHRARGARAYHPDAA
jgi:predicted PurR-regulated permease PerM